MEYNTQRIKLKISDYGRNVSKLIVYASQIDDRDRRNQMAAAIVDIMAHLSGENKPNDDNRRKYWVHLMVLADGKLDVDIPYDISPEESVEFNPQKMDYSQQEIKYRHYGSIMERMIQRVAEYPEGEERDELTALIAHAMKRDYLLWNNDTVEEAVIDDQLSSLSDGKLSLPEGFRFREDGEYLKGLDNLFNGGNQHKKRKRRKKKKGAKEDVVV